jgi:hypothetical protein
MAVLLRDHYRQGERLTAESASIAGLLGGLEKMGDTWMLAWGRLPLNDRRLVIVDETQGLPPMAIEALSDVRSTGIAELTKIRTERTHSRCRIIWLANPPSGRSLAEHNQGVVAIKELFKKQEDIRRLDFAITVASGDVDYAAKINVRHDSSGEPRYSSDLCRALILWAWSRRPEQIVFSEATTDAIHLAATMFADKYHSTIPLVTGADQREKFARLSVAAAARVHSTDATGEKIVVKPEHVQFVVDFLTRAYDGDSMSYGEYSAQQRKGETIDPNTESEILRSLGGWNNSDEAVAYFRAAVVFKKGDLADALGWDESYVKSQIKWMMGKRLIRQVREGYRKQPAFIKFLRAIGKDSPAGEIEEGAAF